MAKELEKNYKNRNVLRNNILCFVTGGIIFSGITAGAYGLYKSEDISYEPSNKEWNVNSVDTALNSLYDIATTDTAEIFFLGNELTYNIKDLYPNIDYASLTTDNFIVGASSWQVTVSGTAGCTTNYGPAYTCVCGGECGWAKRYDWCSCSGGSYSKTVNADITYTYDAETGVLTITAPNSTPTAYLVLGEIEK